LYAYDGDKRLSSTISLHVRRLGDILRRGAEDQVDESKSQLESVKGLYEDLLSTLLVTSFNQPEAYTTALQMFGTPKVKFAAVDGSQDQQLIAGLAVFWGGAYAATGTIEFKENAPPHVEYATGFVERGKGVSSCVPIYVDRVHEVDQMVMELAESGQLTLTQPLTEQGVVDNSTIASWIMNFSELYLAYRLVVDEGVKILLLDRSLSTTQTSLMYDTSKRSRWKTDGATHGFEIDGIPIDMNEMGYGRHYVVNPALDTPPARGDYIRYATIYLLARKAKPMTVEEICMELGIESEDRKSRLVRYLGKSVSEGYLIERGERYSVNPRYANSWARIKRLVTTFGDQLFKDTPGNPMRFKKGDKHYWLTTQDLAFLSLYCLYMLMQECWTRKVLLLGITKDTAARDFKSHVIPVCLKSGVWKCGKDELQGIPSTDRMLLQAISLFNFEKIPVPWSLIEYDTAFQTIVPDFEGREGFVSGARRNRIIPERLFVKSYVQLDEAKTDPKLRSNVLFIDRLIHPQFDGAERISLRQEYGGAVDPIEPTFYRSKSVPNRLQNLVMIILKSMGARSIPEVFGHNRTLFIADKIAKEQRMRMKGLIEATGHWLMNNPKLRNFSFYMHTFRERRAEIEYARRT